MIHADASPAMWTDPLPFRDEVFLPRWKLLDPDCQGCLRVSEDFVPVSEFKAQAAELLKRVADSQATTSLTQGACGVDPLGGHERRRCFSPPSLPRPGEASRHGEAPLRRLRHTAARWGQTERPRRGQPSPNDRARFVLRSRPPDAPASRGLLGVP